MLIYHTFTGDSEIKHYQRNMFELCQFKSHLQYVCSIPYVIMYYNKTIFIRIIYSESLTSTIEILEVALR